jgi:hypothetical protein
MFIPNPFNFCLTLGVAYMNMHGFTRVTFIGIEEKSEGFLAKYDGHGDDLSL